MNIIELLPIFLISRAIDSSQGTMTWSMLHTPIEDESYICILIFQCKIQLSVENGG